MSSPRLIAVLGYSGRGGSSLHEICAGRLRRAERESGPHDVVLLSGWARGRSAASEAEHMADAWAGSCGEVVLDRDARTTVGNVSAAARLAHELEASEVVLVTSGWHARRAHVLLRAAVNGSRPRVSLAVSDDHPGIRIRFREAVGWASLPAGVLALRASRATRRPLRQPRPGGGAPGSSRDPDGR